MKKTIFAIIGAAVISSVLTLFGAVFYLRKSITTKQPEKVVVVKKVAGKPVVSKPNSTIPPDFRAKLPDFAPLVKKLEPAVVHIATTTGPGNPYLLRRYRGRKSQGSLGTGIIIDKSGLIITNFHVIRDARRITVKLSDGKVYPASLKGRDKQTDLAIIKINGKNFPVAKLGNSDKLEIGDWVIAIGNPFGLSNTVTAGIVSAKDRTELNPGAMDYSSYIQTDTAINPGNSGGPLINLKGEVIGINTLVDTRGQGIGYAIPVNRIKRVIPQLEKHGKVVRSFLGVRVMQVNRRLAAKYKFSGSQGAYVDSITPGGPAEKAGLMVGDIITEFNEKPIRNEQDIAWEASIAGIGKKVRVKVFRDHKYKYFNVTLVSHPGNMASKSMNNNKPPLGVYVKDYKGYGARERVVVVKVLRGSVGDKYGIRRGDRIINVGKIPIHNSTEYYSVISKYHVGQNVMLLIDSPNTTRWVVVPYK